MVPIRTEARLAPWTLQGALGQSKRLRGTAELNVGAGGRCGGGAHGVSVSSHYACMAAGLSSL